ncbi:superoxide dismutase [Candidatus Saccharibacteria bacterium]|nr:superoxide dismutase [Candidatus Saccharibacteria bacterium]
MHTLPALPYAYNALAPAISEDIMRLHHAKHHQTYVDKLNAALDGTDWSTVPIEKLLQTVDTLPANLQDAVRNNGGGHFNHSLFWQWMNPDGGGQPSGRLLEQIEDKYGSFQTFVDEFTGAATGLFGSGWVWLQPDLKIITTANQDNPIMSGSPQPILGLDVWEHAYYLDYKNARADYIKAWWSVVDWKRIESTAIAK